MVRKRRGGTGTKRIVATVAATGVAAAMAYAVPLSADAAAPGAPARAAASGQLSPRLSALAAGSQPGTGSAGTGEELTVPESGAGSLLRTPNGKRLVVDLRLSSKGADTIASLEAAGARLLPQPEGYGRLAVSIRPDDLTAVAAVPGVLYVGEEITPIVNATCDATISEGDAILNVPDLRAAGVDGTGVKIGVISDSFDKAAAPATNATQDIASDNLPGAANDCGHTSVSTVADKPTAGTDEGRAMMQIVHDLAPGSPIDFATAFISEPSFAANITALADQGAKVIVDDVSYIDEPMYQDGIVEQAVTGVRARGVNYFSSSANNRYVKNGHEVGSYEAVDGYRPGTCPAIVAITNTHTDCHNFGTAGAPDPTFGFSYVANQNIRPVIQWAEAWDGGVTTDLDLYLIDTNTNTTIGTGSLVNNLTSQQAYEWFGGTLPTNRNLAFVVARKSNVAPAATPRFKFVMAGNGANPWGTVEHETPVAGTTDVMGPTAFGHNGGADAMSVGASDVRVATNLNNYSSFGPVTTVFGPVNGSTPAAALPAPLVVAKPDLVASDCNHTTFFSGASHVFCGTSAAAPHAAAVAALLQQRYPTATPEGINAAMTSSATPIAGVDPSFQGAGLLNARDSLGAVVVPPAQPTVSSTDPGSPGTSTTPKVKGTAGAGSTVEIYATADCSGTPAATGTAADFAAAGIPVTVATGSTTTFKATATNSGGSSPCSSSSVAYTQLNLPAAPTVTGTEPAATGATTTPKVIGTAEAGSAVDVYPTSDCSGSPAATGTAAAFASPGLPVAVTAGSTTTFHATATNAVGTSPCSATSATYTQQDPPAAPTVTGTSPASPGASTTPKVTGTADAGSTVKIYPTADCSGSPAATGTATDFASPGLTVTVTSGSTTSFHATATNGGGTSACSATSATYTQEDPPDAPTVTGTDPASPGLTTTPKVTGTAAAGTTVKIYPTADCSGSPAATGTAAAFTSPGLTVTVAAGSTTTFHATATSGVGTSPCSASSTSYTQQDLPAMPSVTGTDPVSPGVTTTPKVTGTAEAGSTVKLYPTPDCSGSPAASGTAAAFTSPGLTVTVATGSTTTFHATATNAVGTSPCSTTSATYAQQDPPPPPAAPDTLLTKTPPKKVKTTKKKVKVSFEFSSSVPGSTFACSIDGGAFTACTSGVTFKLKAGTHSFAVRATAGGLTDASPASYSFKVKRKRHA